MALAAEIINEPYAKCATCSELPSNISTVRNGTETSRVESVALAAEIINETYAMCATCSELPSNISTIRYSTETSYLLSLQLSFVWKNNFSS